MSIIYRNANGEIMHRKAGGAGSSADPHIAESTARLINAAGDVLIGQQAGADSLPVVWSTEQQALVEALAKEATQQAIQTLLGEIQTAIQALTRPADTQMVSGTVATGGLTDAELRATPVPVAQADAATGTKQDALAAAIGLLAKATDTQPVSAASLPLPANAATQTTLASVLSALQGTLAVNQQPRTLLIAPISRATSGDGTAIVAGAPGSVIRIVALMLLASGDVAAIIKSGSTAMTGPIDLALAGNGFVLPHAPPGEAWLTTADGEDLFINLSDAVSVGGWIVYEVA